MSQQDFQVFVALLSGKTVTLDVAPLDMVADFRQKLQRKASLPWADDAQLLLDGKILDSLEGVESGSTIRLAGRLRGGTRMRLKSCRKLKTAFAQADSNGDGKIGFEDFLKLLRRGQPDFCEDQAQALFYVVDRDLSGEIDFDEFVDYLFDRKSMEDFILPQQDDTTEEEAKALVLGKPVRLRSMASKAVRDRGSKWGALTWKERLAEVTFIEGSVPSEMLSPTQSGVLPKAHMPSQAAEPAAEAPLATEALPEAEAALAAEALPEAEEQPAFASLRGGGGGGLPDLFEAAEFVEVAVGGEAEEEEGAAGTGVPSTSLGLLSAAESIKKGGHPLSGYSQSKLVDYSLMAEDLAWAGHESEVLNEMTAFKEHLRTAGGPFDALEIERYVAKGTAGWVFQAKRKSTGETVALKLIRMTQVRTGIKEWYISKLMTKEPLANIVVTDEESFVLEKATAPDVILEELKEAGPVPYYVCFVQEFVDGGTLEGLSQDGKLTAAMLKQAAEGVAATVAKLHARNIQHRDMKPENILVKMRGAELAAVKLCDFGRAEIVESAAGRADDVRRFGVTLFSLATGEGWTANRLIHEEHSALVERLREFVQASGETSLQDLPDVLEKILSGDLEMSEVHALLQKL